MCGIAGFIGQGDEKILKQMTDTLRHRGPDDEGFYTDKASRCFFGFRRLAIIDLEGGHQPLSNEDGSVWVMLNGEIYNFQELRAALEKRGHRFKTRSDTEVIAHLYEDEDIECFKRFNGMFAIAIWDRRKKRLVLARDRMGKKPVYWARFGDSFLFASEPKAILRHPRAAKRLDRASILKYFFFLSVPSPWTIYENVFKLEPGEVLTYDGGDARVQFFWSPTFRPQQHIARGEALERIDALLRDATRLRLIADVPLGVFLSGGIDSSTVAYYAAKNSAKPIKTFSIGFRMTDFDESRYAELVSRTIGSEHHSYQFDVRELLKLIPEISEFLDEPFADSSVLPTFLLAKYTRKYVTVALGGDGGDELFLGYPTFQAHRVAEFYRRLPRALRTRWIPWLIHLLPTSYAPLSLDYKARMFVLGAGEPVGMRQQVWVSGFHPDYVPELFTPSFLAEVALDGIHGFLDEKLRDSDPKNVDEAAMFLYERFYLGDQVLTKVDRASMAASLEVRAPFLDYRLVEFMNALPPSLRLRFWQNKYLLKRLMRGKLPDAVLHRKKMGFWVPIGPWLRNELAPIAKEYLAKSRLEKEGIFRYPYVEKLFWEHQNGKADHRRTLWSLLMFEIWREEWLM